MSGAVQRCCWADSAAACASAAESGGGMTWRAFGAGVALPEAATAAAAVAGAARWTQTEGSHPPVTELAAGHSGVAAAAGGAAGLAEG